MTSVSSCPTRKDLERLAGGQMSLDEVSRLADHVELCERCVQTLPGLQVEDTLAECLRAQALNLAGLPDPVVDRLIERLRLLRPTVTADTATEDTPGDPSALNLEQYLAPAQGPAELGRLGPYRVLRVLGSGGMGVVFEAEDTQLKRPVALKVMKPALAASATAKRRFLREAQAMAAIEHDHIVRIYQVGEDRGIPFLVMELLQGRPLDRWLQGGARPRLAQVLRIGQQIARGLMAAHERGLMHRDIKPGNLWLEATNGGRVKILDFGLARAVSDDAHLTRSGAIVGTPAYMSPEQARGEAVDHRSDLFSLGCILYRLCTGRLPFPGATTLGVLTALAVEQPPPVHELNPAMPPALSELIGKLLAKDPAERPASAREVLQSLQEIEHRLSHPLPVAVPAEVPVVARPVRQRRRGLLIAAALLVLLAGGGLLAQQIIIRLKKDGQVTELKVPPGTEVEVEKDGQVVARVPDKPTRKGGETDEGNRTPTRPPETPVLRPEPVTLKGGEALSSLALVSRPARIDGVLSWTIETRGPRSRVPALGYSPDGRFLAAGDGDGVLRLWEPGTGRLSVLLAQGFARPWAAGIQALAWSPDGKVLAVGSRDGSLRFWEPAAGKRLRTIPLPKDSSDPARTSSPIDTTQQLLAWSPDGKTLACSYIDGGRTTTLSLDVESGKVLHDFDAGTSPARRGYGLGGLFWLAGGKILAFCREDGVQLWDAGSGQVLRSLAPEGKSVFLAAAGSPDGKTLAVHSFQSSNNGKHTVQLWDLETARLVLEEQDATARVLAWSPDGKYLATGSGIRDARTLNLLLRILGTFDDPPVAWSPDSRTLAVGGPGIRTWGVTRDEPQTTFPGLSALRYLVDIAAWSPDRRTLLFEERGNPNSALLLWEAGADQRPHAAPGGTLRFSPTVAWSPDGKTLAMPAGGNDAALWSFDLTRSPRVLKGQTRCNQLAWSPDGKYLTSERQVWEVSSGSVMALEGDGQRAAWSPDGKLLAVAGYDVKAKMHALRLWDLATQAFLHPSWGQETPISALAWSPDGKTVAFGSGAAVRFWAPDSGKILLTREMCEGSVQDLAWSPDGKYLAAVGVNTVGLYEASGGGVTVRPFPGPRPPLAWSLDGKTLAADNRLLDPATGELRTSLLPLPSGDGLALSVDGHHRGSQGSEKELLYVVQTADGQRTYTPEEFSQKFGWKNDPARVRLLAP